ncbi:MAG: HpaII family restriction endonuclease [Candidatus Peribacteria bacterium]|nr:MAG: HpaII family restriction endonuclease [Candidatus Peribacteria bacterium]
MKANKGEWSEFYAFLKILENKRLFAANKNLEIITDKFFIFKKIIRNEVNQETKVFDLNGPKIYILDTKGKILKEIDETQIKEKILKIFEGIKGAASTTFSIPEAENLMRELLCTQIKADNSRKSDIDGIIYDRISDKEELLGFSVKSMIGGASTLLNAGKTTNFIYEVTDFDISKMEEINNIEGKSKIQDRLKSILENGGTLNFERVSREEFEVNLRKIDTVFPIFIAQMLQDFFLGKANKVTNLVELLEKNQNLQRMFKLSKSDYEYKIKNFLISIALGMVPGKVWDGFTKAHGGYIIVKDNGEVICYHLYNRDEFLLYLYENTKFESASSSRHDYGKLYKENGKVYFNLNLQIRFLK